MVSREGGDLSADLTVIYHVGGAAVGGVDYTTLPGFVVIAAGQSEAFIPLVRYTAHAKVKVFLDAGDYAIGKAQSKLVLAGLP